MGNSGHKQHVEDVAIQDPHDSSETSLDDLGEWVLPHEVLINILSFLEAPQLKAMIKSQSSLRNMALIALSLHRNVDFTRYATEGAFCCPNPKTTPSNTHTEEYQSAMAMLATSEPPIRQLSLAMYPHSLVLLIRLVSKCEGSLTHLRLIGCFGTDKSEGLSDEEIESSLRSREAVKWWQEAGRPRRLTIKHFLKAAGPRLQSLEFHTLNSEYPTEGGTLFENLAELNPNLRSLSVLGAASKASFCKAGDTKTLAQSCPKVAVLELFPSLEPKSPEVMEAFKSWRLMRGLKLCANTGFTTPELKELLESMPSLASMEITVLATPTNTIQAILECQNIPPFESLWIQTTYAWNETLDSALINRLMKRCPTIKEFRF